MTLDKEWDRAVPDDPCHVEIRSLLLGGDAEVIGSPCGGLVVASDRSVAGVIGSPSPSLIDRAVSTLAKDADLLVLPEGLAVVTSVMPHTAAGGDPPSCIVVANRPRRGRLRRRSRRLPVGFPPRRARRGGGWCGPSGGAAGRRCRSRRLWVDGVGVAVCGAWWPTETLWDVGVDTLPGHRRRGHARACFLALARHMDEKGLTPVWGALADNHASLRMAESLGFVPDGELFVVELGSADPGGSAHTDDE